MNILVIDVPADSGGALSILEEFYNEVKERNAKDNKWIFVVSKPNFQNTDHIKVLRYPWVKKSWGHRLYFDHFIAPKLVKKYKVDKVLSLQNVIIPNVDVEQVLYLHNPLPFVNYRFSLKNNKILWAYQNVLSKNMFQSIRSAKKVIVQTKWMKQACVEKSGVEESKVEIVPPKINLDIKHYFVPSEEALSSFFYPASPYAYKNHQIIIEACEKIVQGKSKNFKVVFTLKGDETDHVKQMYREIKEKNLPIEFVGSLSRDKVFDLYTKSVLLFPSYIETFGLPMIEARLHQGVIIASDSPFSHEILDTYENAYFFDPFNAVDLAGIMMNLITGKTKYNQVHSHIDVDENKSLIDVVF
ncbi:glycosyltransferase [Neobacillus sp. NRS-1170]|uniref:glycosyltransferase n=1 Tax=Neobacillus sp. NRS-1170 TaxID=3233898 RepID=UPI003D2AB6C0